MKKSFITTLVAAPLLSLSSMAFAAEPEASEPVLLTSSQMDSVSAGALINLGQINISPITVVQLNILNFANATNLASIISGNVGAGLQNLGLGNNGT